MGDYNYIDDSFRQQLKKYEAAPSTGLWDNIENNIPQETRGNVLSMVMRIAAVVVLTFALFGLVKFSNTIEFTAENNTPAPNNNIKSEQNQNAVAQKTTIESKPVADKKIKKLNPENNIPTALGAKKIIPATKAEEENINKNSILASLSRKKAKSIRLNKNDIAAKRNGDIDAKIRRINILQLSTVDGEVKANKQRELELGGQAGAQYSSLAGNALESGEQSSTEGLMSYAGGINVHIKTNKRISFQTGMHYNQLGYAVENVIPNSSPFYTLRKKQVSEINSYSEAEVPENEITSELKTRNEYVEVPLLMYYKLIDRKLDVQLLGGMSTNLLVNSQKSTTGEFDNNTKGADKVVYNGTVGIGFHYPLFEQVNFSLEPRLKYYMNSENVNNLGSANPFSVGIYSGVTYRF